METIRFDDIENLRSKISEEFGPWSKPIEVTQDKINQFAAVTGDYQWIHVDVERAKRESPFGGPVAHGFLTLSLLAAFEYQNDWRAIGFRSFANYRANKLQFISPVPAGAQIQAYSCIVAVEQRLQGTLITQETAVHVVGNEKPSLVYEGIMLYVK